MKRLIAAGLAAATLSVLSGAGAADASFPGATENFGMTASAVTHTVTFTNTTGSTVNITGFDLNGAHIDGPYSVVETFCLNDGVGRSIAAGASCVTSVKFDPTSVPVGTYTSSFNITYSDGATTTTDSITLKGVADGHSQITRDGISTTGELADDTAAWPVASTDGRFVAFDSSADNLVPGIEPPVNPSDLPYQVYLHDRQTGVTTAISVTPSGDGADNTSGVLDISADGRFVLFLSYADDLVATSVPGRFVAELYLRDTQEGTTRLVSANKAGEAAADASAGTGQVSDDGSKVCFASQATNLLPNQPLNRNDIYCKSMSTRGLNRIDVSNTGAIANKGVDQISMSGDGRYVAYTSQSTNLVRNDTNKAEDVFLRDRSTGRTSRISVDTSGHQLGGDSLCATINANGSRVVFLRGNGSLAMKTLSSHTLTTLVTRVSDCNIGISAGGRYVAYAQQPIKPPHNDQLYRLDTSAHTTRLISSTEDGTRGNGSSGAAQVSTGGAVTFSSGATNLKWLAATVDFAIYTRAG